MKRRNDFGIGGSIILTIVFAVMAVFTYQTDSSGNPLAWIPTTGAIVGIVMTIITAKKAANVSAKKEQQEKFAQSITHDKSFGNGDLKLYFDSSNKKATICATTTVGSNKKVIENFSNLNVVETDNYIVALDSLNNNILRIMNNNGIIDLKEYCINNKLKEINMDVKTSTPTIKAFNDYAFITDDVNQFIVIVTPTNIHFHCYSDIVSFSYEENGCSVYNKSLEGAVVGGLLFGQVGAIVGGNTAKATQNKEVRGMSVKILLKSTSTPTIILKIFEAGQDGSILETNISADRMHYEGLMKEVSGIKDIFSIIIDIVDKNIALQKYPSAVQSQSSASIADELTKLVKLKDAGILSEEEFNTTKATLLNL